MNEPKSSDIQTASLYLQKMVGSYGQFQIEIIVGATKLPDLKSGDILSVATDAAEQVKAAVMAEIVKNSPAATKHAAEEKAQIISLFPDGLLVEEIPNGYCSAWCCKHLPWFIVTTKVGRIKVGWRKRVIEIDWSQTRGTKTAAELFSEEKVTKGERLIHAWTADAAKEYVSAILTSAPLPKLATAEAE